MLLRCWVSRCCPHEETLHHWLFQIPKVKILADLYLRRSDRTFLRMQQMCMLYALKFYQSLCHLPFRRKARGRDIRLITKTRLYSFDTLKSHFYIVKLGFTVVYINCLIFAHKHKLWVLVLTSTHNVRFEQKSETYQIFFHLKVFIFWVVKFSICLSTRVFVRFSWFVVRSSALSDSMCLMPVTPPTVVYRSF